MRDDSERAYPGGSAGAGAAATGVLDDSERTPRCVSAGAAATQGHSASARHPKAQPGPGRQ